MTPARERGPVATVATEKRHREWSNYAAAEAGTNRRESKKEKRGAAAAADPSRGIRARVDTKLAIESGELVLTSSGNDPGLTFDLSEGAVARGPYRLEFRVQSRSGGEAEIYWTTDAETKLPRGRHQTFAVKHDGEWHDVALAIDTPEKLYALRLDPCSAPGLVRIRELKLLEASGRVVRSWPGVGR